MGQALFSFVIALLFAANGVNLPQGHWLTYVDFLLVAYFAIMGGVAGYVSQRNRD